MARVEPDAERVKLLSIPRDLWLPIAGTGSEDRINTAYSNGRQTLIDTIQESLGIPINHYIEVDFSGFQRLVEAIGGVPMWFDTAMRDQHTGLVINGEGCVNLDGEQALALARSRSLEYVEDGGWHTDPTGDLEQTASATLTARLSPQSSARAGKRLRLAVNVDRLHFFDEETEQQI